MALRRRSSDAVLAASLAGTTDSTELTGLMPDPASHRRHGRSWPQRFVIVFNSVVALGLLAAAGLVWYANTVLESRKVVIINSPGDASAAATTLPVAVGGPLATTVPGQAPDTGPTTAAPALVDVGTQNFLLTSSDSRACIDPNSPYAGAFGTATQVGGERADTIMLLRIDSHTKQAAILSFPRDLWVTIDGRKGKSRINSALDRTNPTKLINTIVKNFYLPVDHLINIDFCAFKDLVDAVGGVKVPFEFGAKDDNTGLYVAGPECRAFAGDEALAYVRSRHYQWLDPKTGKWRSDGSSDFGRITRQQDFLKRAMAKALSSWLTNPSVAKGLIDAAIKNVVTDVDLTPGKMLDVANAMRSFDANTVRTFQVESYGRNINGASVQIPSLNTPSMQAILQVFQGRLRLADAANIVPDTTVATTVVATVPPAVTSTTRPTTVGTTRPGAATSTTSTSTTESPTTVPTVALTDDVKGIHPPDDPSCK